MKRRARSGDDSRERILQAAAELFAQRGYAGVGVDEVAARSGIAKTALYYHFGNKDGLLAAVLERTAAAWIEAIRQTSSEAAGPFERLERALAGMRALLEERPWVLRLLQILALEVADEKPKVRATLQAIFRRAREAIVEGMREALGVDLPQADLIAKVVLALLDGISLGLHVDPDEINLDEAFAGLRRVWMLLAASHLSPAIMDTIEQSLTLARSPVKRGVPIAAAVRPRPSGGRSKSFP
jgi:AcrR family transcriptional regulator